MNNLTTRKDGMDRIIFLLIKFHSFENSLYVQVSKFNCKYQSQSISIKFMHSSYIDYQLL
jgi:hypothetical protein